MNRFLPRAGLVAGLLLLTALGARAPAAHAAGPPPGLLDVAGTTVGAPTAVLPLFGSTPGACTLAATPEPYVPTAFTVTPDGSYAVSVVEPIATIPATDDTVLLLYEGTFDPTDACAHFVGIGNATPGSGLTASLAASSGYVLVVAGFLGTEDAFTVRITGPDGSTITPGGSNGSPVANAGPDQTVTATSGGTASVTLDGSGSSDPEGEPLTYAWAEGAAPVATGATPTVALAVGVHTLVLTVADPGGRTASDEVVITVQAGGGPLAAHAGLDRTVVVGTRVTLDGSGSTGALTYAWTLAPAGTLTGADTATPSFCAATAGAYTATLTVSDGTATDDDDVTVTARSAAAALDALAADVAALRAAGVLNKGQANALTRHLTQARTLLGRGKTAEALDVLAGFRRQALSLWQNDGVLSQAQAEALVSSVEAVIGAVASPCVETLAPEPVALTVAAEAPLTVGPNPTSGSAVVRFGLSEAGVVRVSVYDALGREVAVLASGSAEAGSHAVVLDGRSLAPGVYVVRLVAGARAETRRITLTR